MSASTSICFVGGQTLHTEFATQIEHHPHLFIEQFCADEAVFDHSLPFSSQAEKISAHQLNTSCDVVVLALPDGKSHAYVKSLIQKEFSGKIIDFGADHRVLDEEEAHRYYKIEHRNADIVHQFVFGQPELNAAAIKKAKYVAMPGPIASAALLPLKILGDFNWSEVCWITVLTPSYVETEGRICAFDVFTYAEMAEIEQTLLALNGYKPEIKLIPVHTSHDRGIWLTLTLSADQADEIVKRLHHSFDEPAFVKVLDTLPELDPVIGTPFMHIGWKQEKRDLVIAVCLDEQMKGSSTQAIQCLNLMFGWPETLGLI